jgi:hypothetical protein
MDWFAIVLCCMFIVSHGYIYSVFLYDFGWSESYLLGGEIFVFKSNKSKFKLCVIWYVLLCCVVLCCVVLCCVVLCCVVLCCVLCGMLCVIQYLSRVDASTRSDSLLARTRISSHALASTWA